MRAVLQQFHGTSRIAVIGVVVLAIGVSACGRRGALGPPPASAVSVVGHTATNAATGDIVDDAKPNKPFFLDFLL